ncbi:MAG: ribosome recycling factor [Pararobbsia sp.]
MPQTSEERRSEDAEIDRSVQDDLAKIRTGRAHTGLLDHIQVDYYGSNVPISQVANLTLIDARTIGVQPWEKKMVQAVEKAIRESDLGLNPATNGDVIRVPMPALTEERRARTRQGRQDRSRGREDLGAQPAPRCERTTQKLVKDKEISEDEERRAQDDVQKLTDRFVAEIDKLVQTKEGEIMTV